MLSRLIRSREARTFRPPARVPDGLRVYAIGDIHGRADLLDKLDAQIAEDARRNPAERGVVVCLGDYVDRGPDSAGVLERLLRPHPSGIERVLLRGNHEAVMLMAREDTAAIDAWRTFGGAETLLSYGFDMRLALGHGNAANLLPLIRARIPESHMALLAGTRRSLTIGDYFFCHAGIRPGVALEQQREEDLLWIREPFLSSGADFGKIVVHGHTPVEEAEMHHNRINVDTGAYATNQLTCLVLEGAGRRLLVSTGLPVGAASRRG